LVEAFVLGNLPGVSYLSNLSGPLLEHLVLELAPQLSVALGDLTEHVALVDLLQGCFSYRFLFVLAVLPFDFLLDLFVLVLSQPVPFVLLHFLHLDGKGARIVDFLHEVDTSVVLLSPLVVADFLLLGGLDLGQVLKQFFLFLLVGGLLKVMLLQLDDFPTAR